VALIRNEEEERMRGIIEFRLQYAVRNPSLRQSPITGARSLSSLAVDISTPAAAEELRVAVEGTKGNLVRLLRLFENRKKCIGVKNQKQVGETSRSTVQPDG